MSFEINPPRFSQTNANKTQAMDNEGRGASAGGGYASAEEQEEAHQEQEVLEDEIILSSQQEDTVDIDTKIDDSDSLWDNLITFIKKSIYNLIKSIS